MGAKLSHEDHVAAIAANLPSGRVWAPKLLRGSNLNALLRGIAPTFERMDGFVQRFVEQCIPTETEVYLEEWEDALGIPDPCIPIESDPAKRRRNIAIKLALLAGVQTRADFQFIATLFDLVVEVNPGIDHVSIADGGYGLKTPVMDIPADFASVAIARCSIVVVESVPSNAQFPYEFPLPFATGEQLQMRCLFETLKPAHTQIVYVTA